MKKSQFQNLIDGMDVFNKFGIKRISGEPRRIIVYIKQEKVNFDSIQELEKLGWIEEPNSKKWIFQI